MNQLIIITHAVLIGLTPLIPLPVLDDIVKSFFYRGLVRSLATAQHLSLSAAEIETLAEEQGQGCLNGCLFGVFEYLLKRLVRKIIFFLEWQRAIDLATHAYYTGYLIDHAFAQGWYTPGDAKRALQLRSAIEMARTGVNTSLVRNAVETSFNGSRKLVIETVTQISNSVQDITLRCSRLWLRRTLAVRLRRLAPRLARWLYRRLQPSEIERAQMVQVESAVEQALEQETPQMENSLQGLITRLQENLASLPKGPLELLEQRLQKAIMIRQATW